MTKAIFPVIVLLSIAISLFSCDDDDQSVENFIEIPDSNFEAKLISLGIDSDSTINRQILKEDAESVTRLIIRGVQDTTIADLSGIEGFVNLSYLSVSFNDLTMVDLSKNTNLDTLYMIANLLTEIDLSENENLIFLQLESNELEAIEGLDHKKKLKNVQVSFNYLDRLDISNSSVEKLFAGDNDIATIDLSGCDHLKNIFLKTNDLPTIDLSDNPLVETLVLSDNKLENLDVSANEKIEYLWASTNSFTSLDVSALSSLINLSIHNNPTLDCVKIGSSQDIPTISKDDHHLLSNSCSK